MVMAVEKVFSDKCQTELILGEVPGRQWGQQDRQGEIITFLYFEQQNRSIHKTQKNNTKLKHSNMCVWRCGLPWLTPWQLTSSTPWRPTMISQPSWSVFWLEIVILVSFSSPATTSIKNHHTSKINLDTNTDGRPGPFPTRQRDSDVHPDVFGERILQIVQPFWHQICPALRLNIANCSTFLTRNLSGPESKYCTLKPFWHE